MGSRSRALARIDRFHGAHAAAVSTIITGSHSPVSLAELTADYEKLGPELRAGGTNEGLWTSLRREFSELVEIRHADRNAGARQQQSPHRCPSPRAWAS